MSEYEQGANPPDEEDLGGFMPKLSRHQLAMNQGKRALEFDSRPWDGIERRTLIRRRADPVMEDCNHEGECHHIFMARIE